MDTRRNESCSVIFCRALLGIVMLTVESVSSPNTRSATEVLAATYNLAEAITPTEAEVAIDNLEKALAFCSDDYLAFRIKYRIGVIYFKSGKIEMSKAKSLLLANDPNCPEVVRACSLNMVGQISRLQGRNGEALDAFEKLVSLLEQRLCVGMEPAADLTLAKLWHSALFSRAEIYELQRDYAASIIAYDRLLNSLSQNKNKDILTQYAPLVNDRMSQLYIKQGNVDNYIKMAEALTKDYPEYYRTPIIELEIECVKLLRSASANPKFINGSFAAPAQLIAYLKKSKAGTLTQHICDKLDSLCKKHQNTYAGILLQYHYAWFLDTLGEKGKATEILAPILSCDIACTNNESCKKAVIETIQEYAKIQYAILAGERADYKEALRVLSSLQTQPTGSHISQLAESVIESIQILKREVPEHENERR